MWKFSNIYKTTIWGGTRIARLHEVTLPSDKVGECWMLSPIQGAESIVEGGPDHGLPLSSLLKKYGAKILGEKNYNKFGNRFPLLIKILDATADLSIQVHPGNELAQNAGHNCGKAEMWFVLDTERNSFLINGFEDSVTREKFEEIVRADRLPEGLKKFYPQKEEVFYIPPGRVHALGKGLLVVEIQQAADVTYRLFDYHRLDADGHQRTLHTKDALEAIDYNDYQGRRIDYQPRMNFPVNVVSSPEFCSNILNLDTELIRDYSEWDTFVAIVATRGNATLHSDNDVAEIRAGETVLVKADTRGLRITPHGHFTALETYLK